MRLHRLLPNEYFFEDKGHFKRFELALQKQEDKVLEALRKQYPPQMSANVVEAFSGTHKIKISLFCYPQAHQARGTFSITEVAYTY